MEFIKRYKVPVAALSVLVVLGVVFYVLQLANGLGVTGMSNGTSWGLYIASFMFFVGLSAGSMIVASSVSVFRIERLQAAVLPATILSLVGICAAGLLIFFDLGGLHRVWRMLIGFNPTSPLVWDMGAITLYLVIAALLLVFVVRGDQRKSIVVSRIALPLAILVLCVEAWIFGLDTAKEGWYTAILAPIFVASALDSGTALLLLVLGFLKKAGIYDTPRSVFTMLAGFLCVCVAVDAFFIFCEMITTAYPGTDQGIALLTELTAGSMAPFFWFEIICGLVIPFCILVFAKNREHVFAVNVACMLVVLGVFCKRIWLLLTSFIVPNIMGAPGIISGSSSSAHAEGTASFSVLSSYVPTFSEVLVVVGVCALAMLGFLYLADTILVQRSKKECDASNSSANVAS